MNLTRILTVCALLLAGCGSKTSSTTASAADHVVVDKIAAPGEIEGSVSITLWQCGGADLPGHDQGPCMTTAPFSATFAVAKPVAGMPGHYELVAYATSDASGHYSVSVAPGRYTLVTTYAITGSAADATGLSLNDVAEFVVGPGQVVTQDLRFESPPPPIAIGVGN